MASRKSFESFLSKTVSSVNRKLRSGKNTKILKEILSLVFVGRPETLVEYKEAFELLSHDCLLWKS